LIRQALPDFEPAIGAVQIMVAGSFVVALMNMPTKLLIAAGHRWPLVALMLACLAVNGAANWLAVGPLDGGIDGAAIATSASYVATFVALTSYALGKTLRPVEVARHVGALLAVFAYVIGALWAVEALVGPDGGSPGADVGLAVAKLLVFLVVVAPWLVLAEKRFHGLRTLWSSARTRTRRPSGVRP
jgi:O-antigen/teichoic acid export membrane protein